MHRLFHLFSEKKGLFLCLLDDQHNPNKHGLLNWLQLVSSAEEKTSVSQELVKFRFGRKTHIREVWNFLQHNAENY